MKFVVIFSLLVFSLGLQAMPPKAVSTKICFGSTNNSDTKGQVLQVAITLKSITFTTVKNNYNEDGYKGTFQAYNETQKGRDGKTYMLYEGMNTDYQDVIMVDQELMKKGTTGLLQIRARGEGFFNSVYVCKDSNR